jgi:hypothetical protein
MNENAPLLFWHLVTKHIGAKAEVYNTVFGFIKELLKVLKTYFYEVSNFLGCHMMQYGNNLSRILEE